MSEFIVIAERLLLLLVGEVILLEIIVRLKVRLKLILVDGIVGDEGDDLNVRKCLCFVVVIGRNELFVGGENDSVVKRLMFLLMTFCCTS